MPSCRRRRGRGRRRRRERRNWADLPLDAISAIFLRLDQVDILMGPGRVCRSWREAARDDPSLWRHIDMRGHANLSVFNQQVDLRGMAQAAVRRAQGQCEAFWGECAGDDAFLLFLAEQAPSLKSLRLISCYDVSNEGFTEAIKKLPLLEELELSLSKNVFGQHVFKTVSKSCPRLKCFRLSGNSFYPFVAPGYKDEEALQGIATMTELRSLQIFGNDLTNKSLAAILNNCPHLESLDICHCINIKMDDTLRARCSGIKTLRLPNDSIADYFIGPDSVSGSDGELSSEDEDDISEGYIDSDFDPKFEDGDDYYDPSHYIAS